MKYLSKYASRSVPGDPVAKQRPRLGKGGRVYTPARTKDHEHVIALTCRGAFYSEGSIRLTVDFYFQTKRRKDLDNCLKTVGDALNGICYKDDQQIVELHARRFLDRDNPRTEIHLAEITDIGGD